VGRVNAARPPAKVGDLAHFGRISKPAGTLSFGPSNVFNKKEPRQRDASSSYASVSANMFAAPGAAGGDGPAPTEPSAARGGASSRNPSMDHGPGGAPPVESGGIRSRLSLLPRTTQIRADKGDGVPESTSAAPAEISEAEARKVKEDIKVRPAVTWTGLRD
jgi:translation initiation factor 4G